MPSLVMPSVVMLTWPNLVKNLVMAQLGFFAPWTTNTSTADTNSANTAAGPCDCPNSSANSSCSWFSKAFDMPTNEQAQEMDRRRVWVTAECCLCGECCWPGISKPHKCKCHNNRIHHRCADKNGWRIDDGNDVCCGSVLCVPAPQLCLLESFVLGLSCVMSPSQNWSTDAIIDCQKQTIVVVSLCLAHSVNGPTSSPGFDRLSLVDHHFASNL